MNTKIGLIVYFHQHSGAAHSKHWSKYAFFTFFDISVWFWRKMRKIWQKGCFWAYSQPLVDTKCWSGTLEKLVNLKTFFNCVFKSTSIWDHGKLCSFVFIFPSKSCKNVLNTGKKVYFEQRLECSATKC